MSAMSRLEQFKSLLGHESLTLFVPLIEIQTRLEELAESLKNIYISLREDILVSQRRSLNSQKISRKVIFKQSKSLSQQHLQRTVSSKEEKASKEAAAQKTRKGRTKISKHSVTILRNWFTEHFDDPYPTNHEKILLANKTGMSVEQVSLTLAI